MDARDAMAGRPGGRNLITDVAGLRIGRRTMRARAPASP